MCRTHGNGTTSIERYISKNDYVKVERVLVEAKGFIGGWGGRYCVHALSNSEGAAYLDHIFSAIDDQHLDRLSPRELPDEQCFAAARVLEKLRALYDETVTDFRARSGFARLATRVYDWTNQRLVDGYASGIDRLEDVVLDQLRPPILPGASSQERDLPGTLDRIAALIRSGDTERARKLYNTLPVEF